MRNYLRISLTAIAVAFVFGGFAASQTNAQITVQILKRMDSQYKKLHSFQANITYELYDSLLLDTEKREGKAIYLPSKGKFFLLRINWIKPEELLTVVDREYVIYLPGLKQAYTGSTEKQSKSNDLLAFMNMSKAQIKANYMVKYLGIEKLSKAAAAWHLELAPKTAQKYKKADIWVDGNGMPIQMKITANNNDTNTVLLSGIEKNVRIKRTKLKIDLPKGTRIIKN